MLPGDWVGVRSGMMEGENAGFGRVCERGGFLPLCGFRLLLGMLLGNEVAGAELRGGGGQGMLK